VLVLGDSGDPLPAVTVEKGDKVFDVIERLCRLRGLLASDDARGNLILARPGGGRNQGTLELGRTILAGDASFSVKERFSEIRVFGQSPALHRDSYGRTSDDDELDPDPDDDDGDGPTANGSAVAPEERDDIAARAAAVATAQGVARDAGVPRYRLLVVQAETAVEAGGVQGRAEWEVAHRLGKSISLTYTVPGWRGETGALWETNGAVWLRDSLAALDRSLVVGGLEFSLDGQGGMVTKLTLAPQESFEPEPLKAKKPKSGGGRGSDGKANGKSESQGLFAPRGEIATSVRG
jgi:prophage tail gpP-like protein